jgi:murein DD-endopeptidase MepM/ murein hydrolase activator NlpD
VWLLGAALVGTASGLVAGHVDAEDSVREARAEGGAASSAGESCNDAIPPEVIEAIEEIDRREAADRVEEEAPAPRPRDYIVDSTTDVIETPVPGVWMPRGRRCSRRRGRFICDGPRRVPRPRGAAAALAERLGIGTRRMATKILLEAPDPTLVAEVQGHEDDTLLWPVPEGRLWRGYGYVRRGRARRRLHKGLDIGAPQGSLIRSVNDGLVIYADNEVSGYGNLMMVLHADGSVAFYAHARRLYLFAGQQIRRGQVLGEVGHTGIANGDHLHFELRVRGRPRNPLRRMVGRNDEPRRRGDAS